MTADPIRDALREAVRAMNGRMADRGYEVPWPEDGRLIAAAAVAGFLQALPDESGVNIAAPDTRDDWFGCDELVAAVERAATEGA